MDNFNSNYKFINDINELYEERLRLKEKLRAVENQLEKWLTELGFSRVTVSNFLGYWDGPEVECVPFKHTKEES